VRALTAAHQGVVGSGVQADHLRVSIKDDLGVWRDLTTYPGFNAVKAANWQENINDPHPTLDLTLMRELFALKLSPFFAGSALNHAYDPARPFSALIALNRELKVELAIMPMDRPPASGDWFEVFRGRIDSVNAANGYDIAVSARGLSGRLAQQFIKTERVYSYAAAGSPAVAVALRIWAPQTTYALGEYLIPASRGDGDPGLNRFYKNSQAGTSGTTEPTWSTGSGIVDGSAKWDYVGAPSTAGNVVEQVMQNILDDNRGTGDPAVTLYTPTSPAWFVTQFLQQREFTLDAVRTLAQQIGWDLRYKWRESTGQFELTFYQPDRGSSTGTPPVVLYTFSKSDYGDPEKLAVDIAEIRNSWRIIYPDSADLWPDGTAKRKVLEVSDSASIRKYGELWAEIQEDESSLIDTAAEALTYISAALSDCKEPTAELALPLKRGFPWVELNDFYTFTANGVHFDSDQSLAVTAWEQSFTPGKLTTKLTLRGLPTAGSKVHLERTYHPRIPAKIKPHRFQHFQGPKTPTPLTSPAVGGSRVKIGVTLDRRALPEEYELHVYPTSGTPLSSATLQAISKDRAVEFTDLTPGKQYFHKVVPRHRNAEQLVRGEPSTEVSFVAGRASAGHLQDGIALGDYPLNGGFETRVDTSALPDHWSIITGTLATHVIVKEDGNGLSGKRYLRLVRSGGVTPSVSSALFPVINEACEANRYAGIYRVSAWVKNDAGNTDAAGRVALFYLGYDSNDASTFTFQSLASTPTDQKKGHWQKIQGIIHLDASGSGSPPDDRSIRVEVSLNAIDQTVDVDEVRIQYLGTPWYAVGDTTKYTDAYEAIPGFDNTYQAFGDAAPAFRRNQFGRVFLKGAFKHTTTTTVNASLFTLPASYWPATKLSFPVTANGQHGLLEISTAGVVKLVSADNANPSTKIVLDGVSFEVFET